MGLFMCAWVGACSPARAKVEPEVGPRDAAPADATTAPAPPPSPKDAGPPDLGPRPHCEIAPVSAPPLMPEPDALFIAHLGLGGFAMGEATLAQLPDGTRVLIDVGNDSHTQDVVDAVHTFFGDRRIDYVVLTHHHADHEDGLPELLAALSVQTVLHRGLTDLTEAANENVMQEICEARGTTQVVGLCTNGQTACTSQAWRGAATACAALPWRSAGGHLELLAANATVDGISYERMMGALRSDDSNGENARSVLGQLQHGPFHYVFAGDLTGGGSETDAVERFFVAQLKDRLPAADVLHLSHHARDTSSSTQWLDHLLPNDARPRAAVAGVSTAHLGSPHQAVIDAVTPRLHGGSLFVTRVAPAGGSGAVDAEGGSVRVLTLQGGLQYRVQAVDGDGRVLRTEQAHSAARCLP